MLSSLLVSLLLVGRVPIARAGAPEAVVQYRQAFAPAMSTGDADAIAAWMAEDVQVFFPLNPFRVEGREAAKAI
jgi:ketosteroid isomerase-like protein